MSHKQGCRWEIDGRECSCHQPTVWGRGLLYACDCCERPRAALRFTLCPECQRHQHHSMEALEGVHQLMDEEDGLGSAPAGAESGPFHVQSS